MKKEEGFRRLKSTETLFKRTDGGFLSLRIGGKESYPRIHLYRSFPLTREKEFISVRDELERRYFTPTIEKIQSLKQEFGYTYWEVVTGSGFCRFTVKVGDNNVRFLSGMDLLIFDVDGNRFELPEYEKLAGKHLKIVESLL
jgi:hypothetical protein